MAIVPYAVISIGGKQYRVEEGEELIVDRLSQNIGSTLSMIPLFMVSDSGDIDLDNPDKENTIIRATIIDHVRGDKLHASTYKSKVRYHRTVGHRSDLTKIKINTIQSKRVSSRVKKAKKKM